MFRSACHNGLSLSGPDLLAATKNGLHSGSTQTVDGKAGDALGKSGLQGGAAGNVGCLGTLTDLTQNDFIYQIASYMGASQSFLNYQGAQFVGGHAL